MKLNAALILLIYGFFVGCGQSSPSSTLDSGDIIPAEVGEAIATNYFKGTGAPVAVPQLGNDFYSKFAASCDGSGDVNDKKNVALIIGGECRVFALQTQAHPDILKLAAAMAPWGTSLDKVLGQEAAGAPLNGAGLNLADNNGMTATTVAVPKVDLAKVVNQQVGTIVDADTSVDDPQKPGEEFTRDWGDDKFGATTKAHLFLERKTGLKVDAGMSFDGRIFGSSRKIVDAQVMGHGLDGERGELKLAGKIFGQTIIDRTFTEPQLDKSGDLLQGMEKSAQGSIKFPIGPVVFDITWTLLLKTSAPWNISARPTRLHADFNPSLVATVSGDAAISIIVAKGGVGGTLVLVNASLHNKADAETKVESGNLRFCYDVDVGMKFLVLNGRLYAFAEVGWPNRRILGINLGWRGDWNIADWKGLEYNKSLIRLPQRCVSVL